MKAVDLIVCPYDGGRRNWRCGLGPARILQQGAIARIEAAGAEARVIEVETHVGYESEVDLVFEAHRQIAHRAAAARAAERMPIILGGNCNTAVGGVSGTGAERCGVVWFDAHGDFCTPETTDTGFIDGMGLAMLTGRCWRNVLSTVSGYVPVSEAATAIVGARDLDPWEVEDLAASQITEIRVEDVRKSGVEGAFTPFLKGLSSKVDHVYLHIDLDAHDPEEAPANHYNAPNGLAAAEVLEAIALIGQHVRVAGGGLGSYDPAFDPDGRTAEISVQVVQALLAAGS